MERTTSFGYWLRRRRKALDLTQEELARQVGCAVGTIKKLEGDDRRPSRQMAERLADLLQIAPDERAAFLKAARAELAADQLDVATVPLETPAPAELASLPTGTVTFLFTDIEDSTRLWSQHPNAMPAALARHDALLREAIETHGGVVFKTVGDAFYAAFATAVDAVAAALAGQRGLRAEPWGDTGPLCIRAALHSGVAEVRGGDYFGHALSRVARILAAGHGGQVLLSAATWELVRDHLPPDVALHDLGAHWLKSLPRAEQIYQLVAPDLPTDFPPLTTLDRPQTNLPAQITVFIGRERAVQTVGELLRRDEVRLVTLSGPGGTGKTRLGVQVAADALELFEHGVWFVNLAPISDPTLVASTIAHALDVPEIGGQPIVDRLKGYVREKQTLLLLDNFEQVVDAAPLVGELLAAAPGLKVLVTSRMPLRLSGEHEFAVPPLRLPPHPPTPLRLRSGQALPTPASGEAGYAGDLTQYEAVQLFIERAQAVKADFAVTNENAPAVAEICYRLDGLPLAIELAAARIKLFPPQVLLRRLENRLKFLTGGARDLPARQQTIRSTIDWSYELLDEAEKKLFARLGVFVGGCTIEAAEAVCNVDGDLPIEVVDGVAALVDKSLLHHEEGPGNEPCFVMLETIREYALERLEACGEAGRLRDRHLAAFLDLAAQADKHIHGPDQVDWIDRLDKELDNVRAALEWCVSEQNTPAALRLLGALGWAWLVQGHHSDMRIWFDKIRALPEINAHPALYAGLLNHIGDVSWLAGDTGFARSVLEDSRAIWLRLGVAGERGLAEALNYLGLLALTSGDLKAAQSCFERSFELYQTHGDQWGMAFVSVNLGTNASERNDDASALPLLEQGLDLFDQIGDVWGIARSSQLLGQVFLRQGNYEKARFFFIDV